MSTTASRFDAWSQGRSYDAYMGRWSRGIAPRFLDWLDPAPGLDWLELGCGTGALTAAILARCAPRSLIAIDASEGFVAQARENLGEGAADLRVGDAAAPGLGPESRDVVASALTLNFLPDREGALREWRRVLRRGATLSFYVWDYPGGGLAFLRAFWRAAAELDPGAAGLTEDRRFPFCTPETLVALVSGAGYEEVACEGIEAPTVFADFEDYWAPFAAGTGPAPGYVASLEPERRERLRERLERDLGGGPIALGARAWAVRGRAP